MSVKDGCARTSWTSKAMGMVDVQVSPLSNERGIPPTCTAAKTAEPSAVAVKARTPNGGPLANHSLRPGTWSRPLSRSACPPAGIRTISASSIPPPNMVPSMDVIDCRSIPAVATLDHAPLTLRRQISCPSITARHVPPISGVTAQTWRPASSTSPSPAAVNARNPEEVATRTTAIRGFLYLCRRLCKGVICRFAPLHSCELEQKKRRVLQRPAKERRRPR